MKGGVLMMVLINDGIGKRKVVNAELLRENKTTIIVRLPDGNTITRKKKRDLPEANTN